MSDRWPPNPVNQSISIGDTASLDAFGRLRVSESHTIFESKLLGADDSPLLWDEQEESGGSGVASTPTANKPYVDLSNANTTATVMTRQTYRRFHYQPGKSMLYLMTGVLDLSGGGTGLERRIGCFDDDNGAFFEDNAGTIGVTTRTKDSGSAVDTTITQANWNIDVMDGTGPSGFTANFASGQIFVIDFQWLSVGRVRFGLEIDGVIEYIHQVLISNNQTTPWCSTPNLPLRYQLIATSSSPASSMRCISSSIMSEGGQEELGVVHYASTGGAGVVTNAENSLFAVIGIRLKSTHIGATIQFLESSVQIHTASETLEWCILHNPTVADTFTYSGIANSACEKAIGATANTITGGTLIAGGYVESGTGASGHGSGTTPISNELGLGVSIGGTLDTHVLAVRPIGGVSAAEVEGSLEWRELF